jgi:hypothetical protein
MSARPERLRGTRPAQQVLPVLNLLPAARASVTRGGSETRSVCCAFRYDSTPDSTPPDQRVGFRPEVPSTTALPDADQLAGVMELVLSPFQGDEVRRSSTVAFDEDHPVDLCNGADDCFAQAHLYWRALGSCGERQVYSELLQYLKQRSRTPVGLGLLGFDFKRQLAHALWRDRRHERFQFLLVHSCTISYTSRAGSRPGC